MGHGYVRESSCPLGLGVSACGGANDGNEIAGRGRNSGAEESPPVGDLGLSARPRQVARMHCRHHRGGLSINVQTETGITRLGPPARALSHAFWHGRSVRAQLLIVVVVIAGIGGM